MRYEDARQWWQRWFELQGWQPLSFQTECWDAMAKGKSGLLQLPTGAGKTYAAYGGALLDALANPAAGTQIVYVTPLRALSRDIERSLRAPLEFFPESLSVAMRTGDTTSSQRAKQKKEKPRILVTTPESLALLLSYPTAAEDFKNLRTLIIDEWHELLSTKRGSLLELSAARLRKFAPGLKTWALSATLANAEQAARAAVGVGREAVILKSTVKREVIVESLLPDTVDRFPWAGHLGIRMLGKVVELLARGESTLVFTNTRSQAERWYQSLLEARPDWAGNLALHHGSLDRSERERVEGGLKDGSIPLAVCTSSLDLGIDLAPVQQVVQIGSPKSLARLIQRAGRSAHAPGFPCRLFFVPTHAWELVEIAAARDALARGEVESRHPFDKPLDVLAQHLVTAAMGGGFTRDEILAEIRTAAGFEGVTDEEFEWALAMVRDGGKVLTAYPGYHKVALQEGRYAVTTSAISRQHRMNIGTIVSDASILVRYARGSTLGSVEESYVARLKKGDVFLFAGKFLELVMIRDLVAYVRNARASKQAPSPRWKGGKFPLSANLSRAVREKLGEIADATAGGPELRRAAPVLETQRALSTIPRPSEWLIEHCSTREGEHLFLFPFEGRLVHEGLASVLAYRLGRQAPTTFSIAVNDYGFELLAPRNYPFADLFSTDLFCRENLTDDFLSAINLSELARRQFREIARIAGLISQNHPGREKSSRQLQASSSLLFDVFLRYDPDNLLVEQARREVFEQYFQRTRLFEVLDRLTRTPNLWKTPSHPTPLAFPLVVERISARTLSLETLEKRIERMVESWKDNSASTSKEKRSSSYTNARSTGKKKRRWSAPISIGESPTPSGQAASRSRTL